MSNDNQTEQQSRRKGLGRISTLILSIAILTCAGGVYLFANSDKEAATTIQDNGLTTYHTVQRSQLVISVNEGGNIRSSEATIVRSQVEGSARIIELIEAGKRVKEGDLLIQLDDSGLRDALIDQQIMVQNAEADFVEARETEVVRKNRALANVQAAELALELAEIDLEKYEKADYPLALQRANATITIAEEEKARAAEKLKWSLMLEKEGYITQTEREADELAAKRNDLDLQAAKSELTVLKDYTYRKTIAQLKSDIRQAKMEVLRAKAEKIAEDVDSTSDTKARELRWKREQSKLEKIEDQIKKCRITAPCDGMVVYATSGGRRGRENPLEEGGEVYETQELIRLPTDNSMIADIKIHESALQKVKVGMEALITTEAMPGKVFRGRVKLIAMLPDSQSMWLNPDLKVYNTQVELFDAGHADLRPGMSCRAEIIVKVYDNALSVPVQSVVKIKGQPHVYVKTGDGDKPVPVKTGLDDNSLVCILDGLNVDDQVLQNPPLPKSVKNASSSRRINRMEKSDIEAIGVKGPPAATSSSGKPGPRNGASGARKPESEGNSESPSRKGPPASGGQKPAGGKSGS